MLDCTAVTTHLFKHSRLCYWSMFITVFGVGSGHSSALSPGSRSPLSSTISKSGSGCCSPRLAWSGPATAGAAELAETESKLFNDNDDLDKHNNNALQHSKTLQRFVRQLRQSSLIFKCCNNLLDVLNNLSEDFSKNFLSWINWKKWQWKKVWE